MKMHEVIGAVILGYIGVALILTLVGVFVEAFAFAGYMLALALPVTIFGSIVMMFVEMYEGSKGL